MISNCFSRLVTYRAAAFFALMAVVFVGCTSEYDRGPTASLATAEDYRKALATADEGAESSEAESTGTGWGTIRGTFVYDGTPPDRKPYNVTAEHNICSVDGQSPPEELLVVDPSSKGIKNVAIFLRDASRVHDSAKSKAEPVVFDQQHCVFLTHMLGATVGQKIEIKNSDPTGHNTNILGAGFNQLIPQGGMVPYTVQKETGVPLTVKCSIHPWMVAHMMFRKNNYYAVTNDQGQFEIANVPAGEPLEFQVWHESGAAASNGLVGTTPDNADAKWTNRGRVTVTLQPDEVKEINIIVPPNAFRG
jgi:hypothetical protein